MTIRETISSFGMIARNDISQVPIALLGQLLFLFSANLESWSDRSNGHCWLWFVPTGQDPGKKPPCSISWRFFLVRPAWHDPTSFSNRDTWKHIEELNRATQSWFHVCACWWNIPWICRLWGHEGSALHPCRSGHVSHSSLRYALASIEENAYILPIVMVPFLKYQSWHAIQARYG